MLAKLQCTYALVGHSERRQYHGEDDALVNAKVRAAFRHGLIPILCVGEGLEIRRAGNHAEHCLGQLRGALADVPAARRPARWSSPTNRSGRSAPARWPPRPTRRRCAPRFGTACRSCTPPEVADAVRILYGGSVKGDNVAGIMAETDVDGALVGGASLDPVEFTRIVRYAGPGW